MSASVRQLAGIAWRESRTARRRLLLYMSSISLGVAALVAIDSFSGNLTRSVRSQSRALLGGDLSFRSRTTFPAPVDSLLDSLDRADIDVARVTTFSSMAVIPRTQNTRLVQVRAVTEGYPFYGEITTAPSGRWQTLHAGANALVDPAVLVSLDARIGDTLTLGYGRFVIAGTLTSVPGDAGVSAAIGPRIFIPARYLPETQLLVFGSRAEYEALLRLPEGRNPGRFVAPFRPILDSARVRARTVAENEMELTEAIQQLAEFLGIVGLVALLLGGIGVASGVHAFVMKKIDTVAVLRCLGATSRQVLAIYLSQAAAMGLIGAAAGTVLGVGIQLLLPYALGDFLPVDVRVRLEPMALIIGLLTGLWVALTFALRPLVALRHISPLQALRRDPGTGALRPRLRDWPKFAIGLAIAASVIGIAIARSGSWREGIWLAAAIAGAIGALWLSAVAVAWLAKRMIRPQWPFVVRQGIANLYRPANQTRAVVLALGFGVFLIATLYQVQSSLLGRIAFTTDATRPNVLFFDVQEDQGPPLDSLIRAAGHPISQRAPLVPMRIAAINGRSIAEMIADTSRSGRAMWPLRREYRSTYRDTMVTSETLVAGKWFGAPAADTGVTEVSFEREVATELGLELGDLVTWDVQGVRVPTRVTSFREVEWARFEPNFFVVFQPGALADAPKQFVILTDVEGDEAVARLQRAAVQRFPNVSSLDLSLIQRTIGNILEKVSVAIRFMAVLSVAMGIPVLFSAIAATRRERLREGVLLKTLGATRAQIRRVLMSEYAILGLLGSLTGMLLSFGGAWALSRFLFEIPFRPAYVPALVITVSMMALTVGIGLLTGREVYRETPMAALREA